MTQPLIMVGAGHAHLVTLRGWIEQGYQAPPGSLLITPERYAWYSGMMPGLLAGRWQTEQCRIDLAPLCNATGMTLQEGQLVQLDADSRFVTLASGQQLRAGVLSLNSGASNPTPEHDNSIPVIGAKPFGDLHQHWQQWRRSGAPARLAILGGGAAAVELALALQKALSECQLLLYSSNPLLNGQPPRAARLIRSLLLRRGIALHEGVTISRIENGYLHATTGDPVAADAAILATGAAPAAWQHSSGLATDSAGFIRVSATLQSQSHPSIFASGDCAALAGCPRSGVYAVRQGPTLGANLRALLRGQQPQQHYQPQPRALALLATADQQALACYGPLAIRSSAAMWLKDKLDTDFMRSLQMD